MVPGTLALTSVVFTSFFFPDVKFQLVYNSAVSSSVFLVCILLLHCHHACELFIFKMKASKWSWGFPGGAVGKNLPANARD